jgi:hypothetical protein
MPGPMRTGILRPCLASRLRLIHATRSRCRLSRRRRRGSCECLSAIEPTSNCWTYLGRNLHPVCVLFFLRSRRSQYQISLINLDILAGRWACGGDPPRRRLFGDSHASTAGGVALRNFALHAILLGQDCWIDACFFWACIRCSSFVEGVIGFKLGHNPISSWSN